MQRSDSIRELVAALAKARQNFKPIHKEMENPQYRSKYADLSAIIEATQQSLNANGLVVIQGVDCTVEASTTIIETMLAHTSGEWISETLHLPATMRDRFDAQSVGSSQTYGRRYAMQAILGVAAEIDDDATAAVGNGSAKAAAEVADKRIAEMKARMAEQSIATKSELKPVSSVSLPPIPSAANELYGLLKSAKRSKYKAPKKGEWMALVVKDAHDKEVLLSAFDNRKYPSGTDLFTILELATTGKGQAVRFKTKTVGGYLNLADVEVVGNVRFHEGAPVIERQAGEEPILTD
jgi:hypothetical protein